MRVKIFREKGLIMFKDLDDGYVAPVPPGTMLIGELHVVLRLTSTRSGSTGWVAGEEAKKALNDAPYEPLLRCTARVFVMRAERQRYDDKYTPSPGDVFQWGTACDNFSVHGVQPEPDPVRDFIRANLDALSSESAVVGRQGNLTVVLLDDKDVVDVPWRERPRLYNHCILDEVRFAYRVFQIDEQPTAVGLLVLAGMPGCTYIVSADHIKEAIMLPGGRNYLLVHPLPAPDAAAD